MWLIDSVIVLPFVLDTASLCSVAPSLHELDAELAQYGDLLDDGPEDDGKTLLDFDGEVVADVNSLGAESVQRLNELLSSKSYEELDQFALRPTAASLGLSDAIKECLGDDAARSG